MLLVIWGWGELALFFFSRCKTTYTEQLNPPSLAVHQKESDHKRTEFLLVFFHGRHMASLDAQQGNIQALVEFL